MNAKPASVILPGGLSCQVLAIAGGVTRVVVVSAPADANARKLAAATSDALRASGHDGQPTVLALPSQDCFAASMRIDDLPKGDANTLLYRLEEKLPFAAETVAADFICAGEGALGVCAKVDNLAPVVESLTSAGIDVAAIAPAVMLAAQAMATDGMGLLVLPEPSAPNERINLIALRGGRPTHWANIPLNDDDVATHLKLLSPDASATFAATSDVTPQMIDAIATLTGVTVQRLDGSVTDAVARSAAQIAAGRATPWVNFRRGALAQRDQLQRHRRPLNALLAAAALLFFVLALACLVRAQRYRYLVARADELMRREFIAQYPNWSGPINLAVIESEHRKLSSAAADRLPVAQSSALKTLVDVCARLPSKSSFTLTRMSFGETSFELEGRVSDYDQIDALVTASRSAGLNVPAPQARRNGDNSWSFVLRGARSGDSSALASDPTQTP